MLVEPTEEQITTLRSSRYFDPEWYRRTYPDVDAVGMDPAIHYLVYGHRMDRDPGPDFSTRFARVAYGIGADHEPLERLNRMRLKSGGSLTPATNFVLKAAWLVSQTSGYKRAIELAQNNLPRDLAYTVNILQANSAIEHGDETGWQEHLNNYLENFRIAPVRLKGTGTIFERLSTDDLAHVTGGPKVTIIIPAWNAENTVQKAALSILNQTWRNIELFIVDDCSSDGTWSVLQQLASQDDRVKILRNKVNVGPYVSKNLALTMASGEYVTGHDADDWAHPQRIANHVAAAQERDLDASLAYMIRMQPSGCFSHLGNIGSFSIDAVARKASISCLFKRSVLRDKLGFWDSVRFGADSEMIERATQYLGPRFSALPMISMICLDLETSLTNHPDHGVDKAKGISPIRANYRDAWSQWLKENDSEEGIFLPFPQTERRYQAANDMVVSFDDIRRLQEQL